MKYLILGNGAAGSTAAAKLRELDHQAQITVVSAEKVPAYSKIMLPDFVSGKIEKEKLFLRDKEFYNKENINYLEDTPVENINDIKKQVVFKNNHIETYDKLLLSMGGVPFVPPFKGLSCIKYHTINSLQEAEIIKANAIPGKTALIIGGGLTGIEMGFALGRLGMKATIIEKEQNILPQQLDAIGANAIEKELLKHSVIVIAACGVSKFSQNTDNTLSGEKYLAHLENNSTIECSMVIIAIGTRPNLDIVKNTRLSIARGVITDEYMKTNVEDIFAAGDMAETIDTASRGYVSAYIWPNAMAQGKCAAFNMAGQAQTFSFEALKYNIVQLRDMPFVCMGMVKPQSLDYEVITLSEPNKGIYKKLVLKDNIIVGMTLVGNTTNMNKLASLIRKQTNVELDKSKLLSMGE